MSSGDSPLPGYTLLASGYCFLYHCADMNDAALSAQASTIPMQRRLLSIFGGSVGNLVEWFDFYTYSAFSIYFSKSFFPGGDQTAQLLNAAGVFALGFLMRPIGGLVMGSYADLRGRRAALSLSVLLMCLGSLLIAVCPTYQSIGISAPAILIAARVLQGFSMGGEYGSSATYLSEVATPGRRGFYSSFQYVTLIGGQLLATVLLLILQRLALSQAELEAWGWRIPFAVGAACALVALWLRRALAETEEFQAEAARKVKRSPLKELLRHPREVGIVVGLTLGGTVAFYTYSTYMLKFLINSVGLSRDQATAISTGSLFVFMLLQPVMGAISDVVGRRPLLMGFGLLGVLCTFPIFSALTHTRDPWTAFLLCTAALVIVSGYSSINAVVKAELFPASVRALGVALPYAVTVSIFGGTAEYAGLYFKDIGHEEWFYVYVTGCIACSLITYIFMRDTRRHSRIDHHWEPVRELEGAARMGFARRAQGASDEHTL
jgi:MHS family alpha-ketoglutarate permease-like MFS transporter